MRYILQTVAVITVWVASSSSGSACSCAPWPAPEKALQEADAVFLGSVVDFEVQGNPEIIDMGDGQRSVAHRGGRRAVFRVRTAWKGPHEKELVIQTGEGGGDCGFDFVVGREYLVYAYKVADGYGTGICSRTRDVWFSNRSDAKEDFQALGPGTPIEQ